MQCRGQQLEKLLEDAAIKVSAAGDSTRSQGRDVVVAWRFDRVCRQAICPAACQVVAGRADGVAGVIVSVAMRKFPVVLIKVPTPLRAGLVVSFPGVVGLNGDGDSANCHQLHPPWHLYQSLAR